MPSSAVREELRGLATTLGNLPSPSDERIKTLLTGLQVQKALSGIETDKLSRQRTQQQLDLGDIALREAQQKEKALNRPVNFKGWVESIVQPGLRDAQGDPDRISQNAWAAKYINVVQNVLGGELRPDGFMYVGNNPVTYADMRNAGPALGRIGSIMIDPIERLKDAAKEGDVQAAAQLEELEADPQKMLDLYRNHHSMQINFFGDLGGMGVPKDILVSLKTDHLNWTENRVKALETTQRELAKRKLKLADRDEERKYKEGQEAEKRRLKLRDRDERRGYEESQEAEKRRLELEDRAEGRRYKEGQEAEEREYKEQQQLEKEKRAETKRQEAETRKDLRGKKRKLFDSLVAKRDKLEAEINDGMIAEEDAAEAQKTLDDYNGRIRNMMGEEAPETVKFDPEGDGYDYETAEKAGMKRDETGHMGSVVELTKAERDALGGLPEGTAVFVKGRKHETWDLAVKAEIERGSEIYKIGDRYYSVPKQGEVRQPILGQEPAPYEPGPFDSEPIFKGTVDTEGLEIKDEDLRKFYQNLLKGKGKQKPFQSFKEALGF